MRELFGGLLLGTAWRIQALIYHVRKWRDKQN